jgi:Fe-S cluster assembly ATP-binding protein
MTTSDEHLLEIKNLHVEHGDHEILRGVDLAVERGSIHAVLGLNGSGKSTLAYALMGCGGYTADSGEIWFDGEDITRYSVSERGRRGLTLAWQEPARFEGLTIERYLSLGAASAAGIDADRIRAALSAVNLPPDVYRARFVDDSLSGGERKRVELAAVYAMRPKLAVLDEPDSGIDTLSLDDIARLIHRMAEEGVTVLLISHRDEVVAIADTASLICEGQIVDTGKPERVCDRYRKCCRSCDQPERLETEASYERL